MRASLNASLLFCLLLLSACPKAPPKEAAAPPPVDRTPLSQPVSINLNFLGVEGQADPSADFLSHCDPDELRNFPLRFPVANMAKFTTINPAKDRLRFLFLAIWGPYKADARELTLEPGKPGSVEFELEGARLKIEPKLLKPDTGIYLLTLILDSGEVAGRFRIEGWGERVPVSESSRQFPAKQVYNDPQRRLTGYVVRNVADHKHDLQGLIFMGEGYSTDQRYLLPAWAGYKRIFPEMDLQVYPECWFSMRDIVTSCHSIKSAAPGSAEELYGSLGGGSGLARCYS